MSRPWISDTSAPPGPIRGTASAEVPGELAVGWIVLLVGSAVVTVTVPELLGIAWLAATLLSMATWLRLRAVGLHVVRSRWYRAGVGLLLVGAAAEVIAATSTIVIGHETGERHAGFVCVAGSAAALAIAAWRALVRPAPRRAARAGFIAVNLPLAALADVLIGTAGDSVDDVRAGLWPQVMVIGLAAVMVIGAVALLISIVTAGVNASELPEARQLGRTPAR